MGTLHLTFGATISEIGLFQTIRLLSNYRRKWQCLFFDIVPVTFEFIELVPIEGDTGLQKK